MDLKRRVPGAIGLIRTGDAIQYANMYLFPGRWNEQPCPLTTRQLIDDSGYSTGSPPSRRLMVAASRQQRF